MDSLKCVDVPWRAWVRAERERERRCSRREGRLETSQGIRGLMAARQGPRRQQRQGRRRSGCCVSVDRRRDGRHRSGSGDSSGTRRGASSRCRAGQSREPQPASLRCAGQSLARIPSLCRSIAGPHPFIVRVNRWPASLHCAGQSLARIPSLSRASLRCAARVAAGAAERG